MSWPDPAQRSRLVEILDNLLARIAEAEREKWLGEMEGLWVSLAGAEEKLTQLDRRPPRTVVDLGIPVISAPSALRRHWPEERTCPLGGTSDKRSAATWNSPGRLSGPRQPRRSSTPSPVSADGSPAQETNW
ncbi:hypothetical protein [Streptomyces sp. SM11]|uniref:hypothetical protein n=1 Tax=Streptomyces sp. SM11 TaxID=565557 RepID=UPI00215657C0|nr:hypothetical protein [Streptomyces sp. SM11]